jgi:hypothetical protein
MANLKKGTSLLSGVAIVLYAMTAVAQSVGDTQRATDSCKSAPVIPLPSEQPPAKIVIDPPLAEPLASRGVAIIQILCSEPAHCAGVRPQGSGCLAARRTHSCGRRRCLMGVGRWSGNPITDLELQLKKHGIHQLIVMGLIAHTCVEATVRYAAELGYEVTMVKDATEDYSDEEMHAALDVNIPNYARAVVTTNEVVATISSL